MSRRNVTVSLAVIGTAVAMMIAEAHGWPPWTVLLAGMALTLGIVALQPRIGAPTGRATVGRVPALAPAFQQRTGVRALYRDARAAGADIVLHGPGGTGTTQVAVAVAREAVRNGADLVVWVDAAGPASVVTAFALAATQAGAPGTTGTDVTADAHAMVAWLGETNRRWLVVLDGVTDPAHIAHWWPAEHSTTGWFLVTTTGPAADPVFSRGTTVEVGAFSPAESFEYLADCKLADDDVAELATELGHLPLALARAAAYLRAERLGSRDYLNRWIDRRKTLADPATAAVLLAAQERALPVLILAAVLDPAGQPAAVWRNKAVTRHLAGTPNAALRTVALLSRYGLVEYDARLGAWAVRVHPDTAHTVQKNTPAALRDAAARAAADAVLDVWPQDDAYPRQAEHVQVLRANASTLARLDGDPLWRPSPHDLLWRAGTSLDRAALWAAAIEYWRHLAETGDRLGHPMGLTARTNLATVFWQAGEPAEAIAQLERVIAALGADHPDAQAAGALLATWRPES